MPDKNPHTPNPPEDSKKDKIPEVRYIPVEYLPHTDDDEDEIDLIELAKNIWDGRLTIAKITGVFVAIGLFIALFSPVEYESEAILMPEVQQQQDRAGQLLQQFGGAFGFGGGNLQQRQDGTIPPLIYPRIVNSLSFQLDLMEKQIRFDNYDEIVTLPDFFENHYSLSLTQLIKYPIFGSPFKGIDWYYQHRRVMQSENAAESEFIQISKKQMEFVTEVRKRISVNLDDETGLLSTKVTLHDARAAAELNQHLIELLKKYVTDYRLEKVRQDLEFVEAQFSQAKERFEEEQIRLADFRDQNINLSTARAQTELERLQDQKDIAFNVYNSLAQQLEQAKLQLQEQTPVFSIVQSVTVPSDKSSPKRVRIIIISIFLGVFVGLIAIILFHFISVITAKQR